MRPHYDAPPAPRSVYAEMVRLMDTKIPDLGIAEIHLKHALLALVDGDEPEAADMFEQLAERIRRNAEPAPVAKAGGAR